MKQACSDLQSTARLRPWTPLLRALDWLDWGPIYVQLHHVGFDHWLKKKRRVNPVHNCVCADR